MLSPVSIEDTVGYRIEVCTDVLPADIRLAVNNMNIWFEQCKDLRIVSSNDYTIMSDRLKITKGFENDICNYKHEMLKPVDNLKDKIIGELTPIEQNCNHTISCMKMLMINWSAEVKRKRNDEKAEKLRKAKEEEVTIKQVLEKDATKEQKKADLLEAHRKIEVEKRKDLEIKKIEEERNICQIVKQIDETKEKIDKDPSNTEYIEKEIDILERQKSAIDDTIKNIVTDLGNVNNNIMSISKEETAIKINVRKLVVEKDALIIAPGLLLTEKVPKINGIVHAKLLKYRTIDINLVPQEWTKVVITVDDKKVREAIKLKGKNLKIPGIEVYEEDSLRSSSYQYMRAVSIDIL